MELEARTLGPLRQAGKLRESDEAKVPRRGEVIEHGPHGCSGSSQCGYSGWRLAIACERSLTRSPRDRISLAIVPAHTHVD